MFGVALLGILARNPVFFRRRIGGQSLQSHIQHTIPVIEGLYNLHKGHIFMQDGAPAHAADSTELELLERRIESLGWPPYSPDLNPIENVWDWMKVIWRTSYDQLRAAVRGKKVPDDCLLGLVQSIPRPYSSGHRGKRALY